MSLVTSKTDYQSDSLYSLHKVGCSLAVYALCMGDDATPVPCDGNDIIE